MILEQESYTTAQMEIAVGCAKMHRAECSFYIRRTFHQVDKPLESNWPTSSQEDMAPSNKPYSK